MSAPSTSGTNCACGGAFQGGEHGAVYCSTAVFAPAAATSSAAKRARQTQMWDTIREMAYADPDFRRAIEPMGIFTFMRLIDGLVETLFPSTDTP